jgi:hypothetical protein
VGKSNNGQSHFVPFIKLAFGVSQQSKYFCMSQLKCGHLATLIVSQISCGRGQIRKRPYQPANNCSVGVGVVGLHRGAFYSQWRRRRREGRGVHKVCFVDLVFTAIYLATVRLLLMFAKGHRDIMST